MTTTFGILLALACAVLGNLSFLYRHRGVRTTPTVDVRHPLRTARELFASKMFLAGMLVAAAAWLFHLAAMAIAPLSLVQAVLAGGVVLLAIMAERVLGLRVGRRQWVGITMTAAGLILLAICLPAVHGAHSRYALPGMIVFQSAMILAGGLLLVAPRSEAGQGHCGVLLGAAAGLLFGVADVAIKAISGAVGAHGLTAVLSPWLVIIVGASVVSFYASARSLQDGEPVAVIAITSAAANVSGIVGGIVVFGDPLPAQPVAIAVQCLAFVLVIVAAWITPGPIRAARGTVAVTA